MMTMISSSYALLSCFYYSYYIGIYIQCGLCYGVVCTRYVGKHKDDTNTIERRPINVPWLGWLRSPGKYVGGPHHCQQDKAAAAAAPRRAFLAAQSNLATSGSSLDYSPP